MPRHLELIESCASCLPHGISVSSVACDLLWLPQNSYPLYLCGLNKPLIHCVTSESWVDKLQQILWNSCDNRCWHTCSTEEDTVFPWPWNGCDNAHGTTVTSSVVQLWQKRMIPLRQQLHHNLKTFYILVVLLVLHFPCYLGLFVVITYNKYFKYARKTSKKDGILS